MTALDKEPLSSVITKSRTTVSGTNMITRAPYPNGQFYRLRKIDITTQSDLTSGGAIWKFWDQDLSSTTAGTVGSAASALFMVSPPIAASGSHISPLYASGFGVTAAINKDRSQTPRIPFYAGITVQTNVVSIVTLELEVV